MPFFPETSIFTRSKEEWISILYDDREMCSKPAPMAYSVSLTASHLFAAPIYAVAFYTLYAENSQHFKTSKGYLAVHVISNLIFESHLSIAMKPVLYLPNTILRFSGIYFFSYINGGITFFMFYLIILFTCWSIEELFNYRFKLIASGSLSSEWLQITARVVTKQHPEILCASALVLPKSSEGGLKPIHVFNFTAFLAGLIGVSMCCCMGISMILALREMMKTTRTSLRTINMHKSFLISLFSQISVHGIMLGFPIVIYIVSVIFNFSGNEVGYIALVMASLHGTMSTLTLIIINKPLSQIFISNIWNFFKSQNMFIQNQSSFISMAGSRSGFERNHVI